MAVSLERRVSALESANEITGGVTIAMECPACGQRTTLPDAGPCGSHSPPPAPIAGGVNVLVRFTPA